MSREGLKGWDVLAIIGTLAVVVAIAYFDLYSRHDSTPNRGVATVAVLVFAYMIIKRFIPDPDRVDS